MHARIPPSLLQLLITASDGSSSELYLGDPLDNGDNQYTYALSSQETYSTQFSGDYCLLAIYPLAGQSQRGQACQMWQNISTSEILLQIFTIVFSVPIAIR